MTGAGISGNEAVKASNRIPYLPGPNKKNGDIDQSSEFGNGNSSGKHPCPAKMLAGFPIYVYTLILNHDFTSSNPAFFVVYY